MSPPRADSERRREEILAAALRVFALLGYSDATLKQIAEMAGLRSAAHLYYYFPKKEDLFGAVLVRYLTLEPMLLPDELDDPPEVALDRFLRRYLRQLGDPERQLAFALLGREAGRLLTLGLDLSAVDLPRVFRDLVAYLDHQVERGTLRPVDTGQAARAILGIVNFHIQNRTAPFVAPVTDDDSVVVDTLDLVLRGIAR